MYRSFGTSAKTRRHFFFLIRKSLGTGTRTLGEGVDSGEGKEGMQSPSRGAFRDSTKNSETFETGANGNEISWKSFRKIRELLNFRNVNHSTKNSRNKITLDRKFPGKKIGSFG